MVLSKQQFTEICKIIGPDRALRDKPIAQYTSMKVGGVCDLLALPTSLTELKELVRYCHEAGLPTHILGCGSNVIVSDRGLDGVTIYLGRFFKHIQLKGNVIRASAGCSLAEVAAFAAKHSLSGLEFACGIPGSIGGAVRMNAGAYEGNMSQLVVASSYLDPTGDLQQLDRDGHDFSYRSSFFAKQPGSIIVASELSLTKLAEREAIYRQMHEYQLMRRSKQPLTLASAGSAFKRPEGHFAGKLIMDAGLKGFRLQHAGVSDKHAGFIVNYGQASADEVLEVFLKVRETVQDKFDIRLEPEVKFIGSWENNPFVEGGEA